MNTPDDRMYSQHHLWIKQTPESRLIGITDYAAKELGEVDFVELPEPDDELEKGEAFGALETSKAVTDLIAPVSGTVLEINTQLMDEPQILTSAPYTDGWLLTLNPAEGNDPEGLLSPDRYDELLAGLED
jgi:glycine cleavage system H protein